MERLNNKKIFLVTGGLGFIGSHFIEKCLRQGHKVINIDKISYASNGNLEFSENNYSFIKKDICELSELPHCDIIVNFAAESHVDNSISDSINFINSNIKGVYNILELIKNQNIKSAIEARNYTMPLFVQISTDEVFGDIDKGFFKEDDRHHSSNPYSATKSAAEQLVFAWSRTYGIPFLMTRTTNNYGMRQHPEKLIPCAITKILQGNKVPIHGDGSYIRNWIHVEDNVDAIFKIINKGALNEVYHIASEEEYSVNEIVSLICKKMNKKFIDVADYSTNRSGADLRYALNYDKLKKLGWTQNKNLEDSLEDIISFYGDKINDSVI